VTGPLTWASFVQHRLLGPVIRVGGWGEGAQSGELGDLPSLLPFLMPPTPGASAKGRDSLASLILFCIT
jgi:hypothetical protein